MNKNTHILTCFLFIFGLAPQIAFAEIFKCTNEQGAVFYNDKPCPVKDKEKKFNSVKDPKNGYIQEKPQNKKITENNNLLIGEDDVATKIIKKKDADNNQIDSIVEEKKLNAKGVQKNSLSSSPKQTSSIKGNVSGIKITKDASDAQGIVH